MPDISKITLPSGMTYDLKDATARQQIATILGATTITFIGVSSVELTDGGNETPKVNNENITPKAGNLFFYGTQEFIYGADDKWHALGSLETLGALAYKNNASDTYTPTGTVSQPTFSGNALSSTGKFIPAGNVIVTTATTENKTATVSKAESGTATYTPEGSVAAPTISIATAGTTGTIHNPTKITVAKTVIAAAPGTTAPTNNLTYYSVTDETLSLYQLGYTTGDSITTSDITVKTGDAAYSASAPQFTGTGARLVTDNIPVPATYTADFTGTEGNINVSGTPSGTISQPTFTGTQATITVE